MNKEKTIAIVTAVSVALVGIVPIIAKLITSIVENWKL